jgi:RNA polymerase sigma factor (sigma-70 family)
MSARPTPLHGTPIDVTARERATLRGVRRDRADEFRRCFDEHWPAVCRSLARRGAGAQTEDLAAEAFSIAWRKWRSLPDEPLPWLLRTALNLLANARRKDKRDLPLDAAQLSSPAEDCPHGVITTRDSARQVLAALARLPATDREAIVLTAWDGLTATQAAAVSGCSTGAFRVRLHRARAALKAELTTRELKEATA